MNSESGGKLTPEELKRLNQRDLALARDAERQVTLAERNWAALTGLVQRLAQVQEELLARQEQLLTAGDVERHLIWQEERNQAHLAQLRAEVEKFAGHAGSLSERFSSASDKLTSSTGSALRNMVQRTERELTDLKDMVRSWLLRLTLLAAGLLTLLTVLSSLLMLLRG